MVSKILPDAYRNFEKQTFPSKEWGYEKIGLDFREEKSIPKQLLVENWMTHR